MAQTQAQKLRKRLAREGRYDVTQKRGGQDTQISTMTRRTKTKQDAITSSLKKHRKAISFD